MECDDGHVGFLSMVEVFGGLLLLLAVSAGLGSLSRRSKVQSCCIVIDPAQDARMAGAFDPDAKA